MPGKVRIILAWHKFYLSQTALCNTKKGGGCSLFYKLNAEKLIILFSVPFRSYKRS